MKCPLLREQWVEKKKEWVAEWADCQKEKCAWWDNTNGSCAILQLSKSIYYAGLYLPQILEKMPSPEFFKK